MSRLFNLQPRVDVPGWLAILIVFFVWVARYTGRALIVAAHNPRYSGALALVVGASLGGGWAWPAALLLGVATLAVWATVRPVQFRQALRGWRRSVKTYRRRWGAMLRRCDVTKSDVPVPLLLSTRSTPYVDKLRVRIPAGLDETAFQGYRGDLLKWAWRAESVRTYAPQPRRRTVELWNLINDPLTEPVRPFAKPSEALPKDGWPLALIEDGEPWLLKIRGGAAHLFICGISGAGKGSVIGALLDQAQPGIQQKIIKVWGADPQASELGMWRHLFARLVFTQADAATMLEELVDRMNLRTRSLFGISRQHQPVEGDEFDLIILDEGLDLLDKTDRKLFRRIDTALRQLLRKGRKASMMVVFASQRAELAMVEIRKDFPNKVALELSQDSDVDMVLGRGALNAGADAHLIDTPGVAYVATEQGIARVRFPHITDQRIGDLPPAPGNEDPAALATLPDDEPVVFSLTPSYTRDN